MSQRIFDRRKFNLYMPNYCDDSCPYIKNSNCSLYTEQLYYFERCNSCQMDGGPERMTLKRFFNNIFRGYYIMKKLLFQSSTGKECPLAIQNCCFVEGNGKTRPCETETQKESSFKAVNCTYSINS